MRILRDSQEISEFIQGLHSRTSHKKAEKCFTTFGEPMTQDELVEKIIEKVKKEGDQGVCKLQKLIDGVVLTPDQLLVSQKELGESRKEVPKDIEKSLNLMSDRIQSYAQKMMPQKEVFYEAGEGRKLGFRFTPIEKIGAYVPGGLAGSTPLISTVLMNVIPAKVAGVSEITVATPVNRQGKVHPYLLRACEIAGVSHIYKAGGAQGIAAMAYGTESLPSSFKIVGPGNSFVQKAKKHLFGLIDIDMMAGPSEILILADDSAHPSWLAADMLAQAEHDKEASSVLISCSEKLINQVAGEVESRLISLPKVETAKESLKNFGALILAKDESQALAWANELAPEHLELVVQNPHDWLKGVRHAGAIFLGEYSPEVLGDYLAGPSHTLPTSGAARFSSGITVFTFLKSSSLIEYSAEASRKDFLGLSQMARAENLEGHALSAEIRHLP